MYLTRAFLNPSSRAVQADIRSPEGLHKTVMRAFPEQAGPTARATHSVLHRLDQEHEGRVVLLIQSATAPDVGRWPEGYVLDLGSDFDLAFSSVEANPAVRQFDLDGTAVAEGARFAFRLRANTTRKIDTKTGPDGERRNGRRVPVRGDEARLAWLARRAEAAGFVFDESSIRTTEIAPLSGRGMKSITVAGSLFEGNLEVRDPERFREAMRNGIGPGKAYGFGLLSVRRVS